ncbi:hypothetical protein COW36_00885 [bacterium (Candidatus Blackallbacteria) CG17_big_fil_post_rev_8_21_14_2_50_48_46]|uniref:SMP-30/Gluconolactonase/LRE-like region domain-containing protein n=1 Tax=bacterium (Candidatus Blackallbacteria) CG17_big_fil_post_rev_8_21_14_2_50_48_46 TaxID=2014261 RepID=A0A2M7GB72_9BACT|nr:MAG: hypothetical protein COW64_10290 [bacterium (Candidatus Blackallbacteria) CG18_big_fil_WC_8_21_14_2_50_49_26]PIW19424.1 MAG: hypothetical protein COW36_00885 [bacterium (Candidatus Blackallbacteria) CG17_big_fil_post_rev_8_21_14_2_50_48_46]PIW48972.1 MAG: hypothetical protein COW20_07570 [bacterium (Candidatus Blackallbacteria) CG13_big_fil_rev_8_21_14_2_50_49_14]
MRSKNLPIYAKLGVPAAFRITLPVQEGPYAPIPWPGAPLPQVVQRSAFEVLTVAGRQDQVIARQGLRAFPQRVPVWRSGFRNGKARQALFNKPTGLVVDSQGVLYIADSLNHCIRKLSRQGKVSTLAGNGERGLCDGKGLQARFNHPTGLALNAQGDLYVVDSQNACLRKVSPEGETETLNIPGRPLGGIGCGPDDFVYFTTELNLNHQHYLAVCRLSLAGDSEILVEEAGQFSWKPYRKGDEYKPFNPWFCERENALKPFSLLSGVRSRGDGWLDLALDRQGCLYLLEQRQLIKFSPSGELSLISLRYKPEEAAAFSTEKPAGLALDDQGHLYWVDSQNHCIRRVSPEGWVSTVAGYRNAETPWNEQDQFCRPQGIAIDALGRIFITDTGNWRVCQLIPPEAQWHKRLNTLPWFPGPPLHWKTSEPSSVPKSSWKEGVIAFVSKSMRRSHPVRRSVSEPVVPQAFPARHLQDVLEQGSRSQQLAAVREMLSLMHLPGAPEVKLCKPLFKAVLNHEEISIRALLIRDLCDIIKGPDDALAWLDLLETHRESNRLLRKYLIDVLCYMGQTYLLYGHVVPLLVDFIRDTEQDVVEYAFERLLRIRNAGYESLVDPLVEELTR